MQKKEIATSRLMSLIDEIADAGVLICLSPAVSSPHEERLQ